MKEAPNSKELNAIHTKPLQFTTLRAVRHILAGVGSAHRIEAPSAADLFWLRLVSGQLQTAIALLECREERAL